MVRWLFPLLYLVLCETLYLLYELGLSKQIEGAYGMISVHILVAIISPAMPMARWVKIQTAKVLSIQPADPIFLVSFWLRFIELQASVLICTVAIVLFIYLFRFGARK